MLPLHYFLSFLQVFLLKFCIYFSSICAASRVWSSEWCFRRDEWISCCNDHWEYLL